MTDDLMEFHCLHTYYRLDGRMRFKSYHMCGEDLPCRQTVEQYVRDLPGVRVDGVMLARHIELDRWDDYDCTYFNDGIRHRIKAVVDFWEV